MPESLWTRRECVSAKVEDALVLLDLETLAYHSLNATASSVWELLETPATVSTLVESLCARYEIEPAPCRHSVEGLLSTLSASNLVTCASIE